MRTLNRYVAIFVVILSQLAGLGTDVRLIGQEEIPVEWGDESTALLNLIVEQTSANFEKVETLRAEYRFRDGIVSDIGYEVDGKPSQRPLWAERTGIVQVVFDRPSESFFSNYVADGPQRFSPLTGGKPWNGPTKALHRQTVVTPTESYTHRDNWQNPPLDGDPRQYGWKPHESRVVERDSAAEARRYTAYGPVIDPALFYDVGGAPIWRAVGVISRISRTSRHHTVAISRVSRDEPDLIRVVLNTPNPEGQAPWRTEYLFDLRMGGHPVESTEYELNPDRMIASRRWTWVEKDGIWVPEEFWLRTFDFGNRRGFGAEQLDVERLFTLRSIEVNVPLTKEEFTWQRFQLRPGDRVVDAEARIVQVVNPGGDLIQAQEYSASGTSVASRSAAYFWVTFLNLTFLLLLGAIWLFRRWRNSKAAT